MPNYVVVALVPLDTAVIPAESAEEALDKYELPEELLDEDVFTYACTEEEFLKEFLKSRDNA
jgi:hypothetical protein